MTALTLNVNPVMKLTDEEFFQLCLSKMREYRDNGMGLGWLINRRTRQVEIYRPGQEVEVIENPVTLSGENVLPGFVLNLEPIW